MEWTEEHDDYLMREILIVEPFKYKSGTVKRGNAWSQIADILSSVNGLQFRVNQRSVRDRWTHLQKAFRKKMTEEEKASGICPPNLTDLEIAIQEVIEKSKEILDNSAKNDDDKKTAEEMRLRSLETFNETRKRGGDKDDENPKPKKSRSSGTETVAFLRQKCEQDADLRQEELRLKGKELELLKASQEQQQQMILAQMQHQQQQTQLFAALIEKLSKR